MASSTTPRKVRVAVTQAEPAWLDLAASVEKTCRLIDEAASNDAELVAFPECFIPGYPTYIWCVPAFSSCSGEQRRDGDSNNTEVWGGVPIQFEIHHRRVEVTEW